LRVLRLHPPPVFLDIARPIAQKEVTAPENRNLYSPRSALIYHLRPWRLFRKQLLKGCKGKQIAAFFVPHENCRTLT
jgi:hypothetical protein